MTLGITTFSITFFFLTNFYYFYWPSPIFTAVKSWFYGSKKCKNICSCGLNCTDFTALSFIKSINILKTQDTMIYISVKWIKTCICNAMHVFGNCPIFWFNYYNSSFFYYFSRYQCCKTLLFVTDAAAKKLDGLSTADFAEVGLFNISPT